MSHVTRIGVLQEAAALLLQLSHVLRLREGAGAAVDCNSTISLWETAMASAVGGAFEEGGGGGGGARLAGMQLEILRDTEALLLDRTTCVHALYGVRQILQV